MFLALLPGVLAPSPALPLPFRAGTARPAALALQRGAPLLGAHHAVYTLHLQSSPDQSVLAAHGSMVFDMGDACTGWTTAQRLVIAYTDRDGQDVVTISDYATFEAKDGSRLEFHSRQSQNGHDLEHIDGVAKLDRGGSGGWAEFTAPDHKRVALPPGTLLPTAHTLAILDAAASHRKFLNVPLFDGTEASGAQDTFVTIGTRSPPHTERWPSLASLPSTRVHVAFFDRNQTETAPDYEVGTNYFDNGVADDLSMDFGDFVMSGGLTEFRPNAIPRC